MILMTIQVIESITVKDFIANNPIIHHLLALVKWGKWWRPTPTKTASKLDSSWIISLVTIHLSKNYFLLLGCYLLGIGESEIEILLKNLILI